MGQVEKNINTLRDITNKIKLFDFEQDSDEEISNLIKKLEILVRVEWSKYYEEFLSDLSLAKKMVSLYRVGNFKDSTVINIISVMGNMIKRYQLPPAKELFEFFLELKDQRKINYYVSLYIMQFPQFYKWGGRWEYLLSIPKITPKDKSERNFYVGVKKIVDSKEIIPEPYKEKFIICIRELADRANNDFYKNDYLELISKIAV